MSVEELIWSETDFENYKDIFISALEKKIRLSNERMDINSLKRKIKIELENMYGEDSLTESSLKQQDFDSFLSNYSFEDLEYALLGIQYKLPKEVILHLSRQEMMNLFIGLGNFAKKDYLKFLKRNKGETLLELFSRLISGNLSNPTLLKRDYYPKRDKNIIYDPNFNVPDIEIVSADSFFEYCKNNNHPEKENGDKSKKHKKMKKRLLEKGFSDIFFEVKIGKFYIDAVAFDNQHNVIIYEMKGGFTHYEEGIKQLQKYGARVYQKFGILPILVLGYLSFGCYTERNIPLIVNPLKGKMQ